MRNATTTIMVPKPEKDPHFEVERKVSIKYDENACETYRIDSISKNLGLLKTFPLLKKSLWNCGYDGGMTRREKYWFRFLS